jgi:hypothetical protein
VRRDADRQLAVLLSGARIGCAITGAFGIVLVACAATYGVVVRHLGLSDVAVVLAGVVPAAVGVYLAVRALLRARVLGRVWRAPETVELAELAMRWGRPALRVCFADGATETFSTGRADRNQLLEAIRRRAVARATPSARIVKPAKK